MATSTRRLRAISLGTVAALAFALAAPSGASAGETFGTVSLTVQQERDVTATQKASNVEFRAFDVDVARDAGASSQAIADVALVYAAFGWTVWGSAGEATDGLLAVVQSVAACSGASGYNGYYFPWGAQFGLNSCQTSQLIGALGLGTAGAGAVTALLVALGVTAVIGGISGLVAALIGLGAGAVAACQAYSSNGGIWLNLGGSPLVSCWGQ